MRPLVAANATARVIVDLSVPLPDKGARRTPQGRRQLRAAIAAGQDDLIAELPPGRARVTARFAATPALGLLVDAAALEYLLASPRVARIIEDRAAHPQLTTSVPVIDADLVWEAGFDGTGRTVAILDTGVEVGHPFFGGRVMAEACFSTTDAGTTAATLCPDGTDEQHGSGAAAPTGCSGISACDHGTHVAGIAAGRAETFAGVAPGAQIVAIQVFSKVTHAYHCGTRPICLISFQSDQMLALDYLLANRAEFPTLDAINLSLGGGGYTYSWECDEDLSSYKLLIDQLAEQGVATVIAAGNTGYNDALAQPGCISTAVTVAATDDADNPAPFSNTASWLDLWAPGVDIGSATLGGGFAAKSGTSMATPHVAGAVAVLRQARPELSIAWVVDSLRAGGLPVSHPVVATRRIDLDGALAHLADPKLDFYVLTPCRLLDTRRPVSEGGPSLEAEAERTLLIAGRCAVPANARAISVNITVLDSSAAGLLQILPGAAAVSSAAAINYSAGQTRANNAVVPLASNGTIVVRSSQPVGTVELLIDVNGWFQ